VEPHFLKNVSNLIALLVKVSSLSERNDSLLVLDLLVGINDNSNDEIDHEDIQQPGDQEPQDPEKEHSCSLVHANRFIEMTIFVTWLLAEDFSVIMRNI
jgi:hypothetical protein